MNNECFREGNIVKIKAFDTLGTEHEITVDIDDFHSLDEIKSEWKITIDHNNHYAITRFEGEMLVMHRFIMNAGQGTQIDHVNHNGLDNRKKNLRFVTTSENALNRSGAASNNLHSKIKNVYWDRNKKRWKASITIRGKPILLGYFRDKYDAAEKVRKFKELNVPTSIEFAIKNGNVNWDEKIKKWV